MAHQLSLQSIKDYLDTLFRKSRKRPAIQYTTELGCFHERPKISKLVPWRQVGPDGIVYGYDHSFMATYKFRGPDLASATPNEIMLYNAQVNNVLKTLGTGYVMYFEAQRHYASEYKESHMPSPLLQEFEEERKDYYNGQDHFETDFYFTLFYQPPTTNKIFEAFQKDPKSKEWDQDMKVYDKEVKTFRETLNRVGNMLALIMPDIRPLRADEEATYLHTTVSTKRHPIRVNEDLYLNTYCCDSSLLGGIKPKLGDKHMRLVTVLNFPPAASPGYLDIMNSLNIEFRWISRFICMGKQDAVDELNNFAAQWNQQEKKLTTMVRESITNTTDPNAVDENAVLNKDDSKQAVLEVEQDMTSMGFYTMTFVLLGDTPQEVEDKVAKVSQTLNSRGFSSFVESYNSLEAWWGSVPGCYRANIRRPIVSSLNFCHLAPITATWSGDLDNRHLKGPVLLYTDTVGYTPFRLSLHVGDLGHTMVVGPSGSGKSVLLNTLEAHFLKYPDSNVFIFDKAASSRALTLGVGGNFYNLASEESSELSFQPFAKIDEENEKKWAKEWILSYLKQQNMTVTPRTDNLVWEALKSLAVMPPDQRTISVYCTMVQDQEIRLALRQLTLEGSYGKLFDNNRDMAGSGHWQVFEMETLMATPAIVPSTLDYLFHRIETSLKEAAGPSIIVLDECWLFFDNPAFKDKLREYFKDMRKKNTSIIFATQNLSDIATKPDLMTTVMENCPNRIYLPNVNASNQQNKELYNSFGCNDRQISIISSLTPKQDYYYSSQKGNRVFQLALRQAEIPFVTATAKTDQIAMNQYIAGQGENYSTEGFIHYWFQHKGFPDEWNRYMDLKNQMAQ